MIELVLTGLVIVALYLVVRYRAVSRVRARYKAWKGGRARKALLARPHSELPRYMADPGGLFGAPPTPQCIKCGTKDWELWALRCKPCAQEDGAPMTRVDPNKYHDAVR
jgi:hypothetical protein